MKKFVIKSLIVISCFLVLTVGFSCGKYKSKTAEKVKRYGCKDYEFSAAFVEFESESSGDTHFHSKNGNEIFYSYQGFDSTRDALYKLKEKQKEADRILKETELIKGGKVVGKKIVFYAEKQRDFGIDKNYYLLWTKEFLLKQTSMFYWIRSESLAGIEEIEKECKF